ncbi:hypothetical protein LLG10_02680 [bacterium]|nr:hypothetical protein [bacterium]
MKSSKRKRQKRALVRFFFNLVLLSILILGGYYLSWAPIIRIYAPAEQKKEVRTFIRSMSGNSILSLKKLTTLDWSKMKAPITSPVLHRKIPYFWSLHFSEKYQARYIYLNKYIREVDIAGKLISTQDKESVQPSTLLFYYPIEIQSVQNSIDEVYEKELSALIAYLYCSESGLGPKVRNIQFNPNTGITLTIFQKSCLIGFIEENPEEFIQTLEKKIIRLEEYIKTKSSWDEFIQFDFRFSDQIICRKHQ